MKRTLNGEVSHWAKSAGLAPTNRGLPTEPQDLVIVGAGLTGLWLAYFAAKRHPDWKITVLEAKHVGYGASGRNGGWLSTLLPGNRAVYKKHVDKKGKDGTAAVHQFQRAVIDSIDEALKIMESEGIEAGQHRGGNLKVARTKAGLQRLAEQYEADMRYGYRPEEVVRLGAKETVDRVGVAGAKGALFYPQTVAVDPARMVQGLARCVEKLGVTISEGVRVKQVEPGVAITNRGRVHGRRIVLCTEAYTAQIEGSAPGLGARRIAPVNSAMVVTEPLSKETWEQIGWQDRECLMDTDHTFIYAQRTEDGRIAIGGRGSPYFYGSKDAGDGEVEDRTIEQLKRKLHSLFPGVDLPIAHAWRGSIGVTRDWSAGVFYDPFTDLGSARGYAGHGVASTLVAAKTLLDRMDGVDSVYTQLPWNDYEARNWEPEPIRFIGVHSMYRLFEIADAWENKRQNKKTSLLARFGSSLAGLNE